MAPSKFMTWGSFWASDDVNCELNVKIWRVSCQGLQVAEVGVFKMRGGGPLVEMGPARFFDMEVITPNKNRGSIS